MTSNSQEIIQDIRAEFEMMLGFVTGQEAQRATADSIERGLFKLLVQLGAKLLSLFFMMRSEACCREKRVLANGAVLAYHRETKRDYFSIFGKLALVRPYFYDKEVGGESPLDRELSLGEDCYSDLVREVAEYLGVYTVYGKAAEILERLLGLHLSTRALQENMAEDAAAVAAFYEQKAPPPAAEEAEILVIQADGKGVPMVIAGSAETKVRLGKGEKRARKKEAIVTTVYTIAPAVRSPEEVVASFFNQPAPATPAPPTRSQPQHKQLWATLTGKDAALARLVRQVEQRQGEHIQHQVALCDGCEPLQVRLTTHFPDFSLVLDFIHANEYLWDVANSWLGETDEQRTTWVAARTLQILSGQTKQVVADFRDLAQEAQTTARQRAQLLKTAHYFERNLPYMDYPTYLSHGWPIASGVIEGACRHFVKDRCELSGMRWQQTGVENLLHLRAVAENGDWDTYHTYRRQHRHRRLYGSSLTDQTPLEFCAIEKIPSASRRPTQPAHALPSATLRDIPTSHSYHNLPLAV